MQKTVENPGSPDRSSTRPRRRRRWPLVIGTMALTVLVLVGLRLADGQSLALFERVAPGTTCVADRQGGETYCLARVSYPDLLIQKGRSEIHVYVKEYGDARFYSAPDPFPADSAKPALACCEEGLSITDGSITLTWSAATLARLGD